MRAWAFLRNRFSLYGGSLPQAKKSFQVDRLSSSQTDQRLPVWKPAWLLAADLRQQLHQIDKDVCLATEFVCDARWLACCCGHHGNADAQALHSLHKCAKIAVPGKQHYLIELFGQFHCIHGEFDAHAALEPATPLAIVELFGWFCNHGEAVVVEPIEQRSDWGGFLILDDHGVIKRAHQSAATPEFRQQAFVIDIETQRPCGGASVGAVDEQRELGPVPWHRLASGHRADARL